MVSRLQKIANADETFNIEIPVADDITVFATGSIATEGYREDDYFTGTGAWIETNRETRVALTALVGKEDCETCFVDSLSEQAAEKALCA